MSPSFPDGELADAAELGAIDDRSVRVWFRSPGVDVVTATLITAGSPPVTARCDVSESTDWTGVAQLALAEPAPDARFSIEIGERRLTGRFAPSPGSHVPLTFGFGSCHMPFEERDAEIRVSVHARELYPAMRSELEQAHARLLLLLGDQIYADEEPGISVRDDLTDDDDDPPPLAVALEAYRRNYHGFFNERGFRALRETFPTLMIWDDHDIFDNWGSMRRRSALDERLFDAACRAYSEYQHTRNPAGSPSPPPYDWTLIHGDIGILALDLRGARDPEHGTMLGDVQWQQIEAFLTGDAARQVQTLFVTSSVPIAHVSRWFTTLFDVLPERFAGSVKDRWLSRRFIASRDALLNALFAWQASQPARQVILLSGDVHSASAFTIRQRGGPGIIQQVTSSALSTPFHRKQRFFNRIVVHAPNLLEPDYQFERHFLSLTHNFGIARAEPLPTGGHRVAVTIRGWHPKLQATRTVGRLVCVP